jgi:hypothetical protein
MLLCFLVLHRYTTFAMSSIHGLGTFLIGAAFSSAISYDLGLGDWLRKTDPLFIVVVVNLLGVWFYLAKIQLVRRRG